MKDYHGTPQHLEKLRMYTTRPARGRAGLTGSDKAHYVILARRVFPGVRTLAYGQTATVRGEASDALCCLIDRVRCTRQEAPLPLSALDVLQQRTDALLLGWRELVPLRFNNLLKNGRFCRRLHSPPHVLNGIVRVKDAFFFVWWQNHELIHRLLLLVLRQPCKQLSHHLHLNPGTEIINVPLCPLV
jgi:hypothetical protein